MDYSYQCTIRLADTDAAGVIYFANLLHLCHEAYEHCLQTAGMDWQALLDGREVALPIVHTEANFRQPLRWGDRLNIDLYPHSPKPSQLIIHYQIRLQQNERTQPVASASTKHLAIHPGLRTSCNLPDIVAKWLENAPKLPDSKI
jgi:1,4-dihydroxy-2-naphthoyl-CoA hydrolase